MKAILALVVIIALVSAQDACWLRSHGRGAGKPLSACRDGEDKNGALCYRKCSDGYKGIGPVCWKFPKSHGRGAGKPMICAHGLEQNGALCYNRCPGGYGGVGPVCWGNCPGGMSKCGALCLRNGQSCAGRILSIAADVLKQAAGAATKVGAIATAAMAAGKGLIHPIC